MAHVVSLGIEGLTISCFNKKTVDSLDIEGWHMLFLLVLKGWQVVVLTKKLLILLILRMAHVVSLGIEGLASSCFNRKTVDSLDIEGCHMLFLLVLKGLKILVLAKNC